MALINCPECGKAFSDKAVSCPNCAYPLTEMDKIRLGIIDSSIALRQADEMYKEEKYSKAYEVYYALSKQDNSVAMCRLGGMLLNGEGTEPNEIAGVNYLTSSADKGNAEAMLNLSIYYEDKDKEKSLDYIKQSLEKIKHFNEKTQPVVYKKAGILWSSEDFETKENYLETAQKMGADTKEEIADINLKKGIEVLNKGNAKDSENYLLKAKKLGKVEADFFLGQCYYDLSKNSDEKTEMLKKASLYNNEKAREELGEIYYETAVEEKNVEILELASELGNENAMEKLSTIYNNEGAELYSPDGAIPDIKEAVELLQKSSNLGNEEAKKNLSVIYNQLGVDFYNGENGRDVDFVQSERCFKNAIELGSEAAKSNLGVIYNQYGLKYRDGKNAKVNLLMAEDFFLKAVELGNENARKNLMTGYINAYFCYKHGVSGYIRDPAKANECLQKARNFDNELLESFAQQYYDKAKTMTAQGISHDNYKMINSYLKRASRLGVGDLTEDLIAFYKYVSNCYKKGKMGFSKSKTKSNIYMRKAAELGDKEAIKKYKPTKQKSSKGKSVFEKFTGINTTALKKSTKGYGYKYRDYEDYK